MKIQNQNLLEVAIKEGFNLFVGAGFSVLAEDVNGIKLPIGSVLCEELKKVFNKPGPYDLVQLTTILETTKRSEFYDYLRKRFHVNNYPSEYNLLGDLNIRGIYTTNIDDLWQSIFSKSLTKYLNDVALNGSSNDKTAIDFSALHGSILTPDKPLIFDIASLANTYSNSPRVWSYLSKAVEKFPTIFWGYSLNDNGVIKALTSSNTFTNIHKDKWIIIREEDEELSEYYISLGFKIIVSDTLEFLKYLGSIKKEPLKLKTSSYEDIAYFFPKNIVPKNAINLRKRPILDFFLGNSPIWNDIFSNQIYKTSHYDIIKDQIYGKKNVIVLGIPASGKSTLLMMLAANAEHNGVKLVFDNIEKKKAQLLTGMLDGRAALLFVDNFSDSIEAFGYLSEFKNITLVGFDRGHNFGIVAHLINEDNYNILNVTKLTDKDVQGIFDSLPSSIRKDTLKKETNSNYDDDSIFELITRNVKSPSLAERYRSTLKELETKSPLLAEFLILCSYFHAAKVPVSFEMAYSYFSDDIVGYDEIFVMRDQLGDLLKDYYGDLVLDDDQDYYYPRSLYSAEIMLKQAPPHLLKKVLWKTLENVPTTQICSYNIFRRYAYDKKIVSRAFNNWNEGKRFYEEVYINDFKNPYILQHGALYLADKHIYSEAFLWIDKAITQTANKYFSIRNSHAIILFDANINSKEENELIKGELDKSMAILERCITDDKRRMFHALRYGEQAVSYHNRYFDDRSVAYLKNARTWLKEESKKQFWNTEISQLLLKISVALDN